MAHRKGVRRHHNNTGVRQIKRGKTREQVRRIAARLGVPYGKAIDSQRDPGDEDGQ
jgi:hypothetical protein